MAKLTVKQLKQIIREAVQEQIAGGANIPSDVGASRGSRGRRGGAGGWAEGNFSLDQLVAAMKDESDPAQKAEIKKAVIAKLKAAGW